MMDKIKKAFKFGDPSNADYERDIEQKRREHEEHVRYRQMMNTAHVAHNSARGMQNALGSQYQQQEKYAQGWNDPRGSALRGAVPISPEEALIDSVAETNRVMRRLSERLEKQERRIEMLSGFYTWITEVHPEIAAQHKAMRDLYEAANASQEETQERQA